MTKYVALLRGINVGGRTIKMDALREMFASLGYRNVKTLLASGNVVFEGGTASPDAVKTKIERAIAAEFGYQVHILLRSEKEIAALMKSAPFKGVKTTPKTRFYITFLSEKPKSNLKIPYASLGGGYVIRAVWPGHVESVLDLAKGGTIDAMAILEKEFGKEITTRNWNTVEKIYKLMTA
jgi:uncharacterized protein (DUF1697 family)